MLVHPLGAGRSPTDEFERKIAHDTVYFTPPQKPFASLFLALCAEPGTFPDHSYCQCFRFIIKGKCICCYGGGADGSMVLFTSLILAKHLFVPITAVAYLYLELTYGVLCDVKLLLDPKILKLLALGVTALLLLGIGGIIGGYIMYFISVETIIRLLVLPL